MDQIKQEERIINYYIKSTYTKTGEMEGATLIKRKKIP
jgi:hypothetical protein